MGWRLVVALGAFVGAVLLFIGTIAMRDDAVGRAIYDSTWILIGLIWLGRQAASRARAARRGSVT